MNDNPSFLVIGAGAIGGIVAGVLKKNDFDVTLVVRREETARKISTEGVWLSGHCGHLNIAIPAVSKITNIKKSPDFVILATKALEMHDVARDLHPLLPDECRVVSLQNGIVEEELATIIGRHRTIGCVVGWGATLHSERKMEMTSSGDFVIGYLDEKEDEQLRILAKALCNIVPVNISENILEELYSKLIINSCISTVGAICGYTLGKMLSRKSYRTLFLDIIDEAIKVAQAMNWNIPPYAGKLDYYKLLEWSAFRKHLFLLLFGMKYRKLKSSTLQSLEREKKTEVRYFNGFISKKGRQYSIPTPVNDRMLQLVESIESGKLKIDPAHIQ